MITRQLIFAVLFTSLGHAQVITGTGTVTGAGTIQAVVATVANPVPHTPGIYSSPQTLTYTDTTGGAAICWNLGSAPTTDGAGNCLTGNRYISGITVNATGTYYAIGTMAGLNDSGTVLALFTITSPGGPPNYLAYTGQDPIQWPSPVPSIGGGSGGTTTTDTSYSSGTPATLIPCTTTATMPDVSNYSFSTGLGGSGDAIMWDTASAMLHINTVGGSFGIVLVNSTTGACAAKALTRDLDLTNPGSSALHYSFGVGGFSITTAGEWISLGSTTDTTSTTEVDSYTINSSTGQFTHAAAADFAYGLPINTSSPSVTNAPAWTAIHTYHYGDYISYTLTSSQYPVWASNSSAFALGDIIVPTSGNSANCAFKLAVTGTTGGSAPTWSTGSVCNPASTGFITDNTAKWRNLGAGAIFVQQETAAGTCTSSGSAPSFLNGTATTKMPGGHPDIMTVTSDNTCSWTNVGVSTSPAWQSFAGTGTGDAFIAAAFSTNSYGSVGNYNNFNGDQGSGIFAVQYDNAANKFHLYNTATGIATDYVCTGGTGFNCSGGSFVQTTLGQQTGTPCRAYIHNMKAPYGNYIVISRQTRISGTCSWDNMVWRAPQTPFVAATQVQDLPQTGHWAVMHDHLFNFSCCLSYAGNLGIYSLINSLAVPSTLPPVNVVANPCTADGSGSYPTPDCYGVRIDQHIGCPYNPSNTDLNPCAGTTFNNFSSTVYSPVQQFAWIGELVGVTTTPMTTTPGSVAVGKIYRFTHTFATGSNPWFDIQNAISACSQDGKYCAFSTDWNGTLGCAPSGCSAPTVGNGQLAVNPPAGVTYTCLGGPTWRSSTSYATGTLIGPVAPTSGTVFHVFQATTGGTSGTTQPPSFSSSSLGNTVTDGGVTWQDLGSGNCRSDVVVAVLH